MRIRVLLYGQDDPKKCTAMRLVRLGLAKTVRRTSDGTIVLNPFAEKTILPRDKRLAGSITGLDCSWATAKETLHLRLSGLHRRLPPLFAGNPVNYSILNKLTTVEALSAALFILGYRAKSKMLLDRFKWGHTFFELNYKLLEDYSSMRTESEIEPLLREYNITTWKYSN